MILISGCGQTMDDIRPSGEDRRAAVEGAAGGSVGQRAPDFTLTDINGQSFNLYSELERADAVVLYFTMWCPVCDSHTDHMLRNIVNQFPNVRFALVDYVSGSVENSRAAALASGYGRSSFAVLADTGQAALKMFGATMGTTVVIDSPGTVRMNEDYKHGSELEAALRPL